MKRTLYIIALLSLFSCDKFLDRPPLDFITDGEMSFSKNEMELYSNKFYGSFPVFYNYDLGPLEMDNNSDNLVSGNYRFNEQLAGTILVPASGGGWDWTDIRGINFFIVNYSRTKEPFEVVAPYIGEMYFWRAWKYFGLMRNFGDLPWINIPLQTDSKELFDKRVSRSIIADSIIQDLETAAKYLPAKDKAVQGRLHQDVALTLLSRVALYEGTWEKYHNGTDFGVPSPNTNKYFEKAASAAKQVIDKGVYAIEPVGGNIENGYWKLFNQTDLSANKEILLWKKYDRALNLMHYAQNYLGISDKNSGMSKYLVESYLCTDGTPISISTLYKGDDDVNELIKNRDPRLAQTMFVKGDERVVSGGIAGYFSYPDLTLEARMRNTTGYQMKKGVDPNANHYNGDITACIIFRYAEVLLNYAEAKEELGQCDQTVLDLTINELRKRVNMPKLTTAVGFTDPQWEFPTLSPLMNEIRRERRVELALEGYRYDDLMRWAATHLIKRPMLGAKFKQYADNADKFNPELTPGNITVNENGYIAPHGDSPAKNGWQFDATKHYLKPLPTTELMLNKNLNQNPKY